MEQNLANFHHYLNDGLIAYLGNKRALNAFLRAFLREHFTAQAKFLDPFAGSGFVSRLARSLGFTCYANDWEYYAYVLSQAALELSLADPLFRAQGGLESVIAELNRLYGHKPSGWRYISQHYAPQSLHHYNVATERLFYTPANAQFIDAVRQQIEAWYPATEPLDRQAQREKNYLIAMLLVQASKRSNTSGLFKAFHQGYGGLTGDALPRIMSPALLEPFPLVSAPRGVAFCQDATTFVRGHSSDLCYLDPPYNGHQYGSNYFMLNTIARWDCPPVDDSLDASGKLRAKAGIRADWQATKSPFCSSLKAAQSFKTLLDGIDSKLIVLSYNTDGVMAFDELLALFTARGKTLIYQQPYVAYRGGKQSPNRQKATVEYLLCCYPAEKHQKKDQTALRRALLHQELENALSFTYDPQKLARYFKMKKKRLELAPGHTIGHLYGYLLQHRGQSDYGSLTLGQLHYILGSLKRARVVDKAVKIGIIMAIIEENDRPTGKIYQLLAKELKSLAFKKYRADYCHFYYQIILHAKKNSLKWGKAIEHLQKVDDLAQKRFQT